MKDSADETPPTVTFPEYLRTLRSTAKLTQDDVATACGVKQPAVSAWERGEAYPSPGALLDLEPIYKVDVGELLRRMVADQDARKVPA